VVDGGALLIVAMAVGSSAPASVSSMAARRSALSFVVVVTLGPPAPAVGADDRRDRGADLEIELFGERAPLGAPRVR
jgi:hypothetical protein